jgi:hypothetical protein
VNRAHARVLPRNWAQTQVSLRGLGGKQVLEISIGGEKWQGWKIKSSS